MARCHSRPRVAREGLVRIIISIDPQYGGTADLASQLQDAGRDAIARALHHPAKTYAGLGEDQETVAMWNFGIAHEDLPEDLV